MKPGMVEFQNCPVVSTLVGCTVQYVDVTDLTAETDRMNDDTAGWESDLWKIETGRGGDYELGSKT
jgi:hypothetical protein